MKGRHLRFITYLAPSIPRPFFEAVVEHVASATGMSASLQLETRTSSPPRGGPDPFSADEADIGFLCSPGYLWLSETEPPTVALVPAAPVFLDPRAEGRPVYFSDVIVARDGGIGSFAQLADRRWAYNDTCSLSGYVNLLRKLDEVGVARFAPISEAVYDVERIALRSCEPSRSLPGPLALRRRAVERRARP